MGLHGGLVYSLGIWPYVYGQPFEGQGNAAVSAQIIRDRVQSYLAHAAAVMPGASRLPTKTLSRVA